MVITLSAKRLTRFFSTLVALLLLGHLSVQTLRFVMGNESLGGLLYFLSLGADGNLPTFYSSLSLLSCAILLWMLSRADRRSSDDGHRYWLGLSLIFVFLSADEMLEIHEHLVEPMRSVFHATGLFYYGWVVPYGIATLLIAAVYARFLYGLPRRTAARIVIAGSLYVAGALGFEMLGGRYAQLHGTANPAYVMLQTIEETLEMVGVIVFLNALADYAERRFGSLELHLRSKPASNVS